MTVVVSGVLLTLSLMLGGIELVAADASSTQARAEAAADASALAAVAESGPYGSGHPQPVAQRYARLNSARLVSCACPPGSLTATVTVAVGQAQARSTADLDPAAMQPASATGTSGLQPRLAAAVTRLLAASGGRVSVVSGFRSADEQQSLWRHALHKYGSPEAADDWVAPPGTSMHQRGLAVDLGGDLELANKLIQSLRLPLWRPLDNEPWHFELAGSRG